MSDVPRSLQSWVSTIQSVVLTADVFQLFIFKKWNKLRRISTPNERVWGTTQLAKLSFNHSIDCTHSWRFSIFYTSVTYKMKTPPLFTLTLEVQYAIQVRASLLAPNGVVRRRVPALGEHGGVAFHTINVYSARLQIWRTSTRCAVRVWVVLGCGLVLLGPFFIGRW